ncbi:protein SAWADEE HOMEODOMAIN HOMOLOG 1-like [Coffea eugenioides]|uniref:Protein SAWADEE HOMEODOMAIN HOMOLOG 1-like n=1 Tax=Coffea arabica TaxID=13443 RepID=A0A6P6TXZ2_COFAR|nr:protein SAWADEE HOMEODOMAIN HOMOLOG 1-like [Coffea arabica]XP_027183514.1 protein SAWADEE HOMEODOMAIN HOMOLOG 1-like [Coffea eugenioides]
MDLRPRQRTPFSGFTKDESERMEHFLKDAADRSFDRDFCKKLAGLFNRSKGRAGKPVVKWIEVHNWFQKRQQNYLSEDASADAARKLTPSPEAGALIKKSENSQMPKDEEVPDVSKLEFEARSPKDGAWYDIETFLAHRMLDSGEGEVRVRYVGFGPEEDEWVNVIKSVRERSVSLEHSECHKVRVGDIVLCFQERKDVARYYEAEVVGIERRLHDIRGCRCLFTIRYTHDKIEEKVRLRRLCFRPSILGVSGKP